MGCLEQRITIAYPAERMPATRVAQCKAGDRSSFSRQPESRRTIAPRASPGSPRTFFGTWLSIRGAFTRLIQPAPSMSFHYRIRSAARAAGILLLLLVCLQRSAAQEQRGVMGIGIRPAARITSANWTTTSRWCLPGSVPVRTSTSFFSRVHIRLAAFHGRVTADDARGTFSETNPAT